MLFDLGNNYMAGYEKDVLKPRPNAAEEFRALVNGLIGRLPLEIAITHMHPDHDGMAGAFAGGKVPMWVGEGEDLNALKTQHSLDPSMFRTFKQARRRSTWAADTSSKPSPCEATATAARCTS